VFFGAIFILCLIWGEWLLALVSIPSILMSYWLLCDEQDILEMSTKLENAVREAEDLRKTTEKISADK
jgi:hypothetical protein